MSVIHRTVIQCDRCDEELELAMSSSKAARDDARVNHGWASHGVHTRSPQDYCATCSRFELLRLF